jgi:hypothetical protein
MTNAKIITYFILWLAAMAVWPQAGAAKTPETAETPETASASVLVGEVPVNLLVPEGLARVDGLCPEADEFILSLRERFKLKVLAVYADPDEWRDFVAGVVAGRPTNLPRTAIITVTTKMDAKSYDKKAAAKERRKFNNMVSLAINTRPLTALFSNRANAKLRDKLGVDLRFSYRGRSEHVGRFDENERSVSYSTLTSLELNGRRTEGFTTVSALRVGDKFVFLAWVEPDRDPGLIGTAKDRTLKWVKEMGEGNLAGV